MAGVITAHAEFKLAQLRTLAREAAAEVVSAKKAYDEATERYAQWPDSYDAVALQRDALEKAEAHKSGADQILARFEAKMRDPTHQAALAQADELEAKAAALDFTAAFQPVADRIEKTAAELASLIAETLRVVDDHVKTQSALIISAERCGFGQLYRQPLLDPSTGIARFREALERGLRSAPVPDHIIRGATGIRL